ncbi:MAG: glycosyltransferase [Coriobacteriia bacterium]|nr:glycosyltransferase [Coriobacteriia bacterium]
MRIAYFTDCYMPEINGVVTSIESHTRLLAERGHEILIICPKYAESFVDDRPGINVARYRSFSFITNKATRVALPSMVSLVQRLRRFDPDIVHVQTPLSVGVIGLLATKVLRLPNVQTYHTYIPDFMQYIEPARILRLDELSERVTDSYVFERWIESGVWRRIVRSRDFLEEHTDELLDELIGISVEVAEKVAEKEQHELTTRFAWRYTRAIYNRADLVITPSSTLKRELLRHGVTVPVDYLSNGLDLSLVVPKESWEPRRRMLHAGRLGFEKNVDVVIKAFARIRADIPGWELHIAGDGPARESLERLSERLGMQDVVHFLGFVDRSTLAASYRDYDLFVTASTIETQGIVLLEAMATGLPVIGVRALAIPELVRAGRNGIIVPPGDVQGIAEAMHRLTFDDALRERFGRTSRQDVARHDLAAVVTQLETLYQQTIAARG